MVLTWDYIPLFKYRSNVLALPEWVIENPLSLNNEESTVTFRVTGIGPGVGPGYLGKIGAVNRGFRGKGVTNKVSGGTFIRVTTGTYKREL